MCHFDESIKSRLTTEKQITVLAERIGKLPESVDPAPLFDQLGELQDSKRKLSEQIEKGVSDVDSDQNAAVSLESLKRFRKGLRDLIGKADIDVVLRAAIIKKVVAKIEVKPAGFVIHFHAGETHYRMQLRDASSASIFKTVRVKDKKNPEGSPSGFSSQSIDFTGAENSLATRSCSLTSGVATRVRIKLGSCATLRPYTSMKSSTFCRLEVLREEAGTRTRHCLRPVPVPQKSPPMALKSYIKRLKPA